MLMLKYIIALLFIFSFFSVCSKFIIFLYHFKSKKKYEKNDKIFNDEVLSICKRIALGENTETYTILIPIYNECKKVILTLLNNINNIAFSQNQLQVLIVVEEYDKFSLEALNEINIKQNYKIILVPNDSTKTKAKALNYAIQFVHSTYCVVYDCDDIPDTMQLIKAMAIFNIRKDINVVQAKLSYFNAEENLLSSCFTLEYYIWFEYIIPFYIKFNLPVGLCGTSTHFRTEFLKKIGLWDEMNLTEDAEMGMRISLINSYLDTKLYAPIMVRKRNNSSLYNDILLLYNPQYQKIHNNKYKKTYLNNHRQSFLYSLFGKIFLLNSITYEESPISLNNWIIQRTRWMKGFLQTFVKFFKNFILIKEYNRIQKSICCYFFLDTFFISILNMALLPLNMIVFHISNISIIFYSLSLINFSIWVFLVLYIGNISYNKLKKIKISAFTYLFLPIYFLLFTIPAILAFYEFITNKLYWNKTKHGETKITLITKDKQ